LKPWLMGATMNVQPVRASAEGGLDGVSIDVPQSGAHFDAQTSPKFACASVSHGPLTRIGVTEVRTPQGGPATIFLALPRLGDWVLARSIILAVVSSDGTYSALGALEVVSRPVSGGIAIVFTAAVFWWLLTLRNRQMARERRPSKRSHASSDQARWIAGLFISPGDDDPSLSLFQVFFWTVITVWGLAFVFLETGNLLSLTPQMMALLGIAGAGSVLARWIAMRSGGSTSQAPGGGGRRTRRTGNSSCGRC
jgi:hypothetical protein